MDDAKRAELLRYMGFSGQVLQEPLKSRIDGLIEQCLSEQKPYGIYAVYPISIEEDEDGRPAVFVEGTTLVLRGNSIVEYMRGATYCALMAVTLGLECERRIRQLEARSITDAAVYSCVCSDLIECGADKLEAKVVAYARDHGMCTKERYSPGFGDFSIEIQSEFIKVLHADKHLGIHVTPASMLIPSKSTTSVIGLFFEPPSAALVGCEHCSCRDYCLIRETGATCYRRSREG